MEKETPVVVEIESRKEDYLQSISQSLALQALESSLRLDMTTHQKVINEFKKNPSKFTTLEEFMVEVKKHEIKVLPEQHNPYL